MLRTTGHILLSLLLLAATMGLTVSKHYCGTQLVSVSIFGDRDSSCGMSGGCCHEDTDTYKLNLDYNVSQYCPDAEKTVIDMPEILPDGQALNAGHLVDDVLRSTEPPFRRLRTTLSSYQTYRL